MGIIMDNKKLKFKNKNAIFGTSKRPRVVVFCSNAFIYAQAIDDKTKKTLLSADSRKIKEKSKTVSAAGIVGKELALKLKETKIQTIVFDRNGYIYHGKVKALADGIREGGIKF